MDKLRAAFSAVSVTAQRLLRLVPMLRFAGHLSRASALAISIALLSVIACSGSVDSAEPGAGASGGVGGAGGTQAGGTSARDAGNESSDAWMDGVEPDAARGCPADVPGRTACAPSGSTCSYVTRCFPAYATCREGRWDVHGGGPPTCPYELPEANTSCDGCQITCFYPRCSPTSTEQWIASCNGAGTSWVVTRAACPPSS